MAWEFGILDVPAAIAGADFSGANGGSTNGYKSTAQFLFCKLSAENTYVPCSGLGDLAIGVSQTNPKAGSGYANVGVGMRLLGVTKIVLSGTLAAGATVGTDANGLAVARVLTSGGADAGRWWNGILLEGGAVGELGVLWLIPPQIVQA